MKIVIQGNVTGTDFDNFVNTVNALGAVAVFYFLRPASSDGSIWAFVSEGRNLVKIRMAYDAGREAQILAAFPSAIEVSAEIEVLDLKLYDQSVL